MITEGMAVRWIIAQRDGRDYDDFQNARGWEWREAGGSETLHWFRLDAEPTGSEINAAKINVGRYLAQQAVDATAASVRDAIAGQIQGAQMDAYNAKEVEARDIIASGNDPHPYIDAEAARRGMTVEDLAAEVVARADAWKSLNLAIEVTRKGLKTDIDTMSLAALEQLDVAASYVSEVPALADHL